LENRLIVDRLREEAGTTEVAECIVRLFAFEVENAPKKKPHFREPFNECIRKSMPQAELAAEDTAAYSEE
jgi:hypothetical protein